MRRHRGSHTDLPSQRVQGPTASYLHWCKNILSKFGSGSMVSVKPELAAMSDWSPVQAPGCALEGLLQGLASVAKTASEELGPGAAPEKLVAHAVKVNVFQSMCRSLFDSPILGSNHGALSFEDFSCSFGILSLVESS